MHNCMTVNVAQVENRENDSRFSARCNRGVTDFDVCSHGTIGRQDEINVFLHGWGQPDMVPE